MVQIILEYDTITPDTYIFECLVFYLGQVLEKNDNTIRGGAFDETATGTAIYTVEDREM